MKSVLIVFISLPFVANTQTITTIAGMYSRFYRYGAKPILLKFPLTIALLIHMEFVFTLQVESWMLIRK